MPTVVYDRRYNIGFYGLEKLHPFDSRKYGRAWKVLNRKFGDGLKQQHLRPRQPVNTRDQLLVHTSEYLHQLRVSSYVAGGNLSISAEAILKRDLFVVSELRKRNIPTVMVLSGGYTRQSYQLVADSVAALMV